MRTRRPEPARKKRRLKAAVIGGAIALTVTAGSAAAWVTTMYKPVTVVKDYGALQKPVTKVGLTDTTGTYTPDKLPSKTFSWAHDVYPVNVLLIGSDTREGQRASFGTGTGGRADTTMLIQFNEGRTEAVVVSFPRDLWVTVPSCETATGTKKGFTGRFNAAYTVGGAGCVAKTVTQLTNIPVNHFVIVNFKTFEETINTIGGVTVCLPAPVKDSYSLVDLPAGVVHVTGRDALALARVRHNVSDGSDLTRIGRQHNLMKVAAKEIETRLRGMNLFEVTQLLNTARSGLATDTELGTVPALLDLLTSGLTTRTRFVTVPTVERGDHATVKLAPEAGNMFRSLAESYELPPRKGNSTVGADKRTTTTQNGNACEGNENIALW
jgi:LCP family protein required for cell wall assembly